ncbi:MAG TPA: hypothetical protein EYG85_03620 [Crocinitomix sp.]|nr:hypothetical protein [Crocinitomix sp.]
MKTLLFPLIMFISINIFSQTNNTKKSIDKNQILHKKEVVHNNYDLDNSINLIDVDIAPIYKGCEDKKSNYEKINCLNTNITIDTRTKFLASGAINKSKLKRGNKRVRVIFIIDENGNTIVKNILGNWPRIIVDEIKKAIESTPKLIPAIQYEKKASVKYSVKIHFTV